MRYEDGDGTYYGVKFSAIDPNSEDEVSLRMEVDRTNRIFSVYLNGKLIAFTSLSDEIIDGLQYLAWSSEGLRGEE